MYVIDKSLSVKEYLNFKIPYCETEPQINLKQEEAIKKYSEIMVGTLNERIDLMISSVGLNPDKITLYHKLILITQLIPYCEKNYNLYLVGDSETSKSTTFYCFSNIPCRYTGLPSSAELRGSKVQKNIFSPLLCKEILVLEEVVDDKTSSDSIPILKEFMESGIYYKENIKEEKSTCSVTFIGNNYNPMHQFSDLKKGIVFSSMPKAFKDNAFLERFNAKIFKDYKYKISSDMLLKNKKEALNINFLIFYLIEMRTSTYKFSVNFGTDISSRDIHRTRATISGLLKMLYPNEDASPEIIRGIYHLSLHLRFNGLDKEFHSPFNADSIPFILEGLGIHKTEVESVVLIENRMLIQKKGKNIWEKIALNEWGLDENIKELTFYKKTSNSIFASIDLANSSCLKIYQDYYPVYSLNCTFFPCGNLKRSGNKNQINNYDYNNQIIARIKSAVLYKTPFPKEKLKEWRRMSDDELIFLINSELKISIKKIQKSSYFYDDKYTLRLINFSQYID